MALTRGLAVISWLKIDDLITGEITAEEKARLNSVLSQTAITVEADLKGKWAAALQTQNWPSHSTLLADPNTWNALGENIKNDLEAADFQIDIILFDAPPHADDRTVQAIIQHVRKSSAQAIIAVGSGTLNDLAKAASYRLGVPYAVCGTAPSMNGYLSANAAIMEQGHKRSVPAHLPRVALFDLSVLKAAPARMKASGFGDALCRSTAQVDWLLSHHLLGTTYDPLPFALLMPHESALMAGDEKALILSLLLSGLGMTLAGGSYPASQGEHLLAHYIEMHYPHIAHQHFHGEHIAVTTLEVARHQEKLLACRTAPALRPPVDQTLCRKHFGDTLGQAVWQEWHQKQQAVQAMKMSDSDWLSIAAELRKHHIRAQKLEAALLHVGAPTTPQAIGWSAEMMAEAWRYAPLIRNRFTCLDVVAT